MKFFVIFGIFLIFAAVGLAADEADKAVGYWKSISDVKGEEGKVTAIWKLTVNSSGQLEGSIVYVPGKPANETYVSQKKEFNGKPVQGTKWMTGLRRSGSDSWNSGQIVDIGNDKADVYGCEVKVTQNGTRLEMRGYLGVSWIGFLGRTQVWEFVSEAEVTKLIANQVK